MRRRLGTGAPGHLASTAKIQCMQTFEFRRDRFETFASFANPTVNIGFTLVLPDFRPFCKERHIPPFHFFLFCLLTTIRDIDNFMYRIYEGEVIKIDEFIASYTVINEDNNYNYAAFEMSDVLEVFVERSVAAGKVARASRALINDGKNLSPRERKNNIYTTCMPWIDMTSIAHPVFSYQEPDIPLIAWGKYGESIDGRMTLPFSVQAHHGFVDGYHIHLLGERIGKKIAAMMAAD